MAKSHGIRKTFWSRPRPRPGVYFFVLEASPDRDRGLENHISGYCTYDSILSHSLRLLAR